MFWLPSGVNEEVGGSGSDDGFDGDKGRSVDEENISNLTIKSASNVLQHQQINVFSFIVILNEVTN